MDYATPRQRVALLLFIFPRRENFMPSVNVVGVASDML